MRTTHLATGLIMAVEIRQHTLTIPPNTPVTAPFVQDMSFPPRTVEWLQIIVPPGNSGLVGWQVRAGGGLVIPYESDQWVITSGEYITWTLENAPTSGAWSAAGYNTGVNPHSVYMRFGLGLVTANNPTGPAMIDDTVINSSAPGPSITIQ